MKKIFNRGLNWIKTHRRLSAILFILTIVFLFTIPRKAASYFQGPKKLYETKEVVKKDLFRTISASGVVEAENQVELKFQTSGLLTWVGVKEGDQVKKWQTLASLDKRQLHKSLEKDLNDYLKERWDFEQEREDYDASGISLEKALISDAGKRILQKSQFDLNNAVLDVEISDITERLATVVSPIDGIVTHIDSPLAGVNVTPATATFIIADPSQMKFVANVDEADIRWVRMGDKVELLLDAYPDEKIESTISKIAFASVTTKGGGTAFQIELLLPNNGNQKYKIGLNGDTEIILDSREQVLSIPLEAVQNKNGKKIVQIIEGKDVKEVEVTTDLETETDTEITSGLKEKQLVIVGEKKS